MGPLKGYRVIEMAGIGPAPFCAMMLADMGAEIIRIDRREEADLGIPGRAPKFDVLARGRRTIAVDVKSPAGGEVVRRLAASADALIEGFRPGVMERLGLGPGDLARVNPRLVFGRMTGFGQEGPYAPRAGHDINYIALAGVLHSIGRKGEAPIHPLNLVGDYGGGGMYLAFGVVCALLEAQKSGKGQVGDAAMVDGAASLMSMVHGMWSEGRWNVERGSNVLDTGAPWYNCYETKDGKWVSIGSIERRFYADLLGRLGLAGTIAPAGRSCASVSRRCSSRRPGPSGRRRSRAVTPALPRCSPSRRWQPTRTTPCAGASSCATGCSSQPPRRVFRALCLSWRRSPSPLGPTRARCSLPPAMARPRLRASRPTASSAAPRERKEEDTPMDFAFGPEQLEIRSAIEKICQRFGDDYWLTKDREGGFPAEFHQALAADGWLGIAMPEEFGGAGLGITEAALMMQAIAESGAGMQGASAVHMNIFGLHPVVVHGTPEQKRRFLSPLIQGREKACFAVTEPNVGLDTTRLKTRATREGNRYRVDGQKIWISTAQVADKVLLLARTTPLEEVKRPTEGLSLFYTTLDRKYVEVREIEKMGRKAVDSNQVFIDGLPVPLEDRIGEEGKGFRYILDGMNPERILIAAEAVGLGRVALKRATQYAKDRVVFGRPIGQNQGIQHPLAKAWIGLEAANLMVFKAASLYDQGEPCGIESNAAKYLAAEAGFEACETAVLSHGGMGYSKEFHVERYLREIMLCRIAPISRELILSNIAERQLGLPKSY
jgi:acyl-CoA dehydrogenase